MLALGEFPRFYQQIGRERDGNGLRCAHPDICKTLTSIVKSFQCIYGTIQVWLGFREKEEHVSNQAVVKWIKSRLGFLHRSELWCDSKHRALPEADALTGRSG